MRWTRAERMRKRKRIVCDARWNRRKNLKIFTSISNWISAYFIRTHHTTHKALFMYSNRSRSHLHRNDSSLAVAVSLNFLCTFVETADPVETLTKNTGKLSSIFHFIVFISPYFFFSLLFYDNKERRRAHFSFSTETKNIVIINILEIHTLIFRLDRFFLFWFRRRFVITHWFVSNMSFYFGFHPRNNRLFWYFPVFVFTIDRYHQSQFKLFN